jgi:hypothetical protein
MGVSAVARVCPSSLVFAALKMKARGPVSPMVKNLFVMILPPALFFVSLRQASL